MFGLGLVMYFYVLPAFVWNRLAHAWTRLEVCDAFGAFDWSAGLGLVCVVVSG